MNFTEQTYTMIPEIEGTMLSEQATVDVAGIHAGSLIDPGEAGLPVIARIPDLDAPAAPHRRRHSSRSRRAKPGSASRRLLSANLSMSILIGLGLILMLAAIGPYIVVGIADKFLSRTGETSEGAWQSAPPAPTADLAPAWKPPIAQSPPALESGHNNISVSINETPAAGSKAAGNEGGMLISPQAGKLQMESAAAAQSSPWPKAVDDQADFSPWPNPAHPIIARAVGAESSINESHTADRRNAPILDPGVRTPLVPPLKTPDGAQPGWRDRARRNPQTKRAGRGLKA